MQKKKKNCINATMIGSLLKRLTRNCPKKKKTDSDFKGMTGRTAALLWKTNSSTVMCLCAKTRADSLCLRWQTSKDWTGFAEKISWSASRKKKSFFPGAFFSLSLCFVSHLFSRPLPDSDWALRVVMLLEESLKYLLSLAVVGFNLESLSFKKKKKNISSPAQSAAVCTAVLPLQVCRSAGKQ